jgi:hypothetical protein
MKKYLLLVMLSLVLFNSCRDNKDICSIVEEMLVDDQLYRKKHRDVLSPYIFILDSLLKSKGYEEGSDQIATYPPDLVLESRALAKEMLFARPQAPKSTLDSILNLQDKVDSLNVLKMIGIIKENGFEKLDTLGNGCAMDGLIVFDHTPYSLIDSVLSIIKPDLRKYDTLKYEHILWQLYRR